MKKIIFLALVCFINMHTTSAVTHIIIPAMPKPNNVGFQQFAKEVVQNAAGLTAIGALGYGGYQLTQSVRHWWKNNPESNNKTNESMAKFLVALLVAASAGTIATADLSTVNFNVHFDIVRALELLFKARSS